MKRILPVLRGFLFIIILLVIVLSVQQVLSIDNAGAFENVRGFYREKPGSLDCVFVGSSNAYCFWEPVFGWDRYGITSWNFAVPGMPMQAVKYYIIEARKTQPDALIMVNLNCFRNETAEPLLKGIHFAVDYFPFSVNKIRMINALNAGPERDYSVLLESFFPIIRFHSRWSDLQQWSFGISSRHFKSSLFISGFTSASYDLSEELVCHNGSVSPPDDVLAVFSDLLSFCQQNHLNVLFVKIPQFLLKEEQEQLNYMESMAVSAGFPCLDLFENMDDLNLDLKADYYNKGHTNVHGAIKISDAIGRYLVDHYSFSDKRGLKEYADWDADSKAYMNRLKPYILPFEPDHPERADLAAPELNAPVRDGQSVLLSWKSSGGADGYEVYRKSRSEWVLAADLPGSARSLRDQAPESSGSCSYTVVPYRLQGEKKLYGRFDVHGVGITAGGN